MEEKCAEADRRHQQLSQAAAQHGHESAKRDEDEMPRFMKRQIDVVHERFADIIRRHRRDDELGAPDHQQDVDEDAAAKDEGGNLFLERQQAVFEHGEQAWFRIL